MEQIATIFAYMSEYMEYIAIFLVMCLVLLYVATGRREVSRHPKNGVEFTESFVGFLSKEDLTTVEFEDNYRKFVAPLHRHINKEVLKRRKTSNA